MDKYNLTEEQRADIKELYNKIITDTKGCKTQNDFINRLQEVQQQRVSHDYEVHEHPAIDTIGINVVSHKDYKTPNRVIGIACYIDKTYTPLHISKYIDVFFNDEEYALQDYEVEQ